MHNRKYKKYKKCIIVNKNFLYFYNRYKYINGKRRKYKNKYFSYRKREE